MLRDTCATRKDVPAEHMTAYCSCYIDLVQSNILWKDLLLADTAVRTKRVQNLDGDEKKTMIMMLEDASYCFWKHVPGALK